MCLDSLINIAIIPAVVRLHTESPGPAVQVILQLRNIPSWFPRPRNNTPVHRVTYLMAHSRPDQGELEGGRNWHSSFNQNEIQ